APALVDQIFAIVRDVRSLGVTVLIAEQNARMALAIGDRGYVLENGCIVAQGTGRELLGSPEIVERYLGIGEPHAGRGADARSVALSERLTAILGAPVSG
ncbi:MAG TPA: ABC transporter ATP-binding protein, partial [Candidatus Elarobacter sp.]|nr:ABC transporter ATP-binding protein [Candidatus Elarobacter sp.]